MNVLRGAAGRRAALSCLLRLSLPFVLSGLAVLGCSICLLPSITISGALVPAPTMTPVYFLTPSDAENSALEQPFADIGVWWIISLILCVSSLGVVSVVSVVRWKRLPRLKAEIDELEARCRQQENDIRDANRTLARFNRLIENTRQRRGR